jgi:uncharacterized protein (DUF58 family)
VGVATFDEKLEIQVPSRARRGHLQEILEHARGDEAPRARSRLKRRPSTRSPRASTRRTVICVVLGSVGRRPRRLWPPSSASGRRRHDVALFHVLDPDELDFPFEDSTLFVGMEDQTELNVDAPAIREAYLEEAKRFLAEAEQTCRTARVEYNLARTDKSPATLLAGFLSRRTSIRATVR